MHKGGFKSFRRMNANSLAALGKISRARAKEETTLWDYLSSKMEMEEVYSPPDSDYGKVPYYAMTLEEIGKELGITRERVRQIEKIALLKIRDRLEDTPFNKVMLALPEPFKPKAKVKTIKSLPPPKKKTFLTAKQNAFLNRLLATKQKYKSKSGAFEYKDSKILQELRKKKVIRLYGGKVSSGKLKIGLTQLGKDLVKEI